MLYTLRFFSLQNAVFFIMLTCLVPVLFTFYTQSVLKLKKNNYGAKGLTSTRFEQPHCSSSGGTAIYCIYGNWYMSCVYVDWLLAGSTSILPTASQHKRMTCTNCCMYTVVPRDDEQWRPIHAMRQVSVPSERSVFTLSVVFSHLPQQHVIGDQRLFPSNMQPTATEWNFPLSVNY